MTSTIPLSGEGYYGMDQNSSTETRVSPALNNPSTPVNSDSINETSTPSSARSSFERFKNVDSNRLPTVAKQTNSSRPRDVIIKAFLPRVAVYASPDTEELIRLKNIYGGLCGLLRPFGETVSGKVGVRDSGGLSKSWDDYGVHFFPFEKNRQHSFVDQTTRHRVDSSFQEGDWSKILKAAPEDALAGLALDEVIRHQLDATSMHDSGAELGDRGSSPLYYELFLRKLLSEKSLSPHETFSHPVACLIAISSQNPDPIATLGDLYQDTRAETGDLPPWINNGFLRYYVLVHDEDNDDISSSTALFAQMKRNFGLHCHLLRLRSKQCSIEDPEVSLLPLPQWSTADEDAANIRHYQGIDSSEARQYIFDADAAVIKSFVREMVTQSIVPYMENRVAIWNEQVASKRRGVTGRLMSISKRWTSFGSTRGTAPSATANKGYDSTQGSYKSDSAVAIMHRLADYAFMLRDWKLSSSIYDLLRVDFNDDKAWHHYAEAHQMAAISLLVSGQGASSRSKIENINQLLDTATYSFITRCNSPREAVNCMIMAMELYNTNGGLGNREASRWGKRLLELSIMSPISQVLLAERLSFIQQSQDNFNSSISAGALSRRGAFWSLLAAQSWARAQVAATASAQLRWAQASYREIQVKQEFSLSNSAQDYLKELNHSIDSLALHNEPSNFNQETDTFVENLGDLANVENVENTNDHQQETSLVHRRGLSQQISLKGIVRPDNQLFENDDGFS